MSGGECDQERLPNSRSREAGPIWRLVLREGDLCKPARNAPHCRDVDDDDTGPATCDAAPATRTVSPVTSVSGGLLIIRSDGDRPAMTSTLSPRSRPNFTRLRTTLSLLSRVATCVP